MALLLLPEGRGPTADDGECLFTILAMAAGSLAEGDLTSCLRAHVRPGA